MTISTSTSSNIPSRQVFLDSLRVARPAASIATLSEARAKSSAAARLKAGAEKVAECNIPRVPSCCCLSRGKNRLWSALCSPPDQYGLGLWLIREAYLDIRRLISRGFFWGTTTVTRLVRSFRTRGSGLTATRTRCCVTRAMLISTRGLFHAFGDQLSEWIRSGHFIRWGVM